LVLKRTGTFFGEIKDLPDNIYKQWANKENVVSLLKNILTEAEDVFYP